MKKYFLPILFFVLFTQSYKTLAQSYSGYRTGSFTGIHGALYNPASLADNKLMYDFNLSSVSISAGNNFLTIDNSTLFNPKNFNDPNFKSKFLRADTSSGKGKTAYANIDIMGPGFFTAISDKDAIGFYMRVRGMINIDGLDQGTANIIWRDLLDSELGKPFSGDYTGVNANLWAEYAVPYARVVMNDGKNLIKVGGTLKLLQGVVSNYVTAKDFTYTHLNRDTIINMQADVQYGHSVNQFWGREKTKFKFEQGGLGIDLGIIYEYRPDFENQKYEMDGKKDLLRKDIESYKLKLGFSITDIGTIVYKKSELSRNYLDNTPVFDLDLFKDLQDIEDLDTRVANLPGNVPAEDNGKFSMNLPMAMNLFIDYNAGKGFFLNLNPIIAFKTGRADVNKTHFYTNFALTPRWESRWFGFYLPIEYNNYLKFNAGFSMRLGPVFIGSGSMLSNISRGETSNTDFHGGIKIPIPYKRPHDKDKDGVSDKLDLCPDVKGTWETKGCPDRDMDGILDNVDKCPDDKGLKEFDGCPDRDGDKVIDKLDDCVDIPGLAALNGCPDKDGDGIKDGDDKCPDLAGPKEYQGCPDRDGDKVIDPEDLCPDEPGLIENKGCPYADTDGDGIKDKDDKCPTVKGPLENNGCPYLDADGDGIKDSDDKCPNDKGPLENNGCPYADTDKDGVLDKDDKCPNTPGVISNFGCPEIKAEEKEILKTAFDNLEFETGKSIIKATSFASLDQLADLLNKKPDFKLLIEGHTDNVGNRESNMTLSKNRANALKKYLNTKGVPDTQMTTKWYGPDKPIDVNTTPEGRQHNRRVEMNIVFE